MNIEDLQLTQNAYVTGSLEAPYYTAHALDKDGNEYEVRWKIICDDFDNLEDESNACNWAKPSSITKL